VSLERGDNGNILIPADKSKTSRARTIGITRRLRAVLEMRRTDPTGQEQGPDAYVFGNEVGERVKSVRTGWENALRRAGITGLHFHDLRRENGSRLYEAGATLAEVRDHLGHTNVSTTDRYLASSAERQRKLARFLDTRTDNETAGSAEIEGLHSIH
jgi:integrase